MQEVGPLDKHFFSDISGQALTLLATLTVTKELKCVEDQLKIMTLFLRDVEVVQRAMLDRQRFAAVHACEVMKVPFHWRIEGFAGR